jgi:hypothetical protein
MRIATADGAEGFAKLWQLFAKEQAEIAAMTSESAFNRHVKQILADEECGLHASTNAHNECHKCKIMKGVVGNRHQKAEAAKQKAGKILDQTSEEALTLLAEVDKMKREHEVPVVHRVLCGCRC